ncbi:YVTN family beta-propeller protein [Leucobacter luti]|uniref:YncE family protein n=1 Tax=Leucobacter luti TaxID=340320 RepID=UPI00105395B9|nr:hypothetical protein [Leucobacter luti]MCW2287405.1 YVTN family beta-propeller protein [Leucobacter luti]TCK41627.1 YVTN family beta-propeller protein [Leucobacter luti]
MARSTVTRRLLLALPALLALGLLSCAPEPVPEAKPTPTQEQPRQTPDPTPDPGSDPAAPELLLASLAHSDEVAVIDPARAEDEVVRRITVGTAPWGVGVHTDADGTTTGYAATAEGLAIVDLAAGERIALVPFAHPAPSISSGEYRPGGLGLAVSPDGTRVYVAVTEGSGPAWLEVIDTATRSVVQSVPVGVRPFDVLVAPDGSWAATVDHDSFTVTVVDAETFAATTYEVAPFGTAGGLASWEKAHYGAVAADGTIWLPYQGETVVGLDPRTGAQRTVASAANSHAHGTALAETRLLTVGTGAFGSADGTPNLSILDLESGAEQVVPLALPHETVAVWRDADGAEYAAVAGGNTRDEGWDGVTLVALDGLATREIPVPGYPQVVVTYPAP